MFINYVYYLHAKCEDFGVSARSCLTISRCALMAVRLNQQTSHTNDHSLQRTYYVRLI